MADKKISGFSNAGALTGAEVVPLLQGGTNVKDTLNNLLAFFNTYTFANYIPITGTSVGNPVTGPVEYADAIGWMAYSQNASNTYGLFNNTNEIALLAGDGTSFGFVKALASGDFSIQSQVSMVGWANIKSNLPGNASIDIESSMAGFKGLQYIADLSANFTARSLVDRGWVSDQLDAMTLQVVTDNGKNTTNTITVTKDSSGYTHKNSDGLEVINIGSTFAKQGFIQVNDAGETPTVTIDGSNGYIDANVFRKVNGSSTASVDVTNGLDAYLQVINGSKEVQFYAYEDEAQILQTSGSGYNGLSVANSITQLYRNDANPINFSAANITVSQEPTLALGIASKSYVDSAIAGLKFKKECRVASTGNIDVSLPGTTMDSVTLSSGDRIFLKDQTAPKENGPWVFNGPASSLTRPTDGDTGAELVSATFPIAEGTVNADRWFTITNNSITLGTTSIVVSQTAGTGTYTYGNYLKLTGNVFDIDFTTFSTSQITEGSNKYYTDARVRAAIAGTTNRIDYNSTTGVFDVGSNVIVSTGTYSNPSWISALAWSKITGTPTTVAGYGIADGATTSDLALKENLRTRTTHGDSDFTLANTDKYVSLSAALTASRTWTLSTGVGAGQEVVISDDILGVSYTTPLIIAAPSGKKLNGVTNGTVLIYTPGALRRFTCDGSDNYNYDSRMDIFERSVVRDFSASTAVTGTTAETIAKSYEIAANIFAVGDAFESIAYGLKTGVNATYTIKAYLNTSNAIGGVQIATITSANASSVNVAYQRIGKIRAAAQTLMHNPATSAGGDFQNGTITLSTLNIDWTVKQYLIVTITNGHNSDSTVIYSVFFSKK